MKVSEKASHLLNQARHVCMARHCFWILLLVFLLRAPVFGLEFINQGLATKIELPDGYENVTKAMAGKAMVALRKVDPFSNIVVRIVMLQDLGTLVGQKDLPQRQPGPGMTLERAHWKKFDLLVCKIIEDKGTTFNTQIPFRPHALQLTVFGPNKDEAQLRMEMQNILDSAEGPTNWLTDEEISSSIRWALIRVLIGAILLVGLVVFLVRRNRAAQSSDDILSPAENNDLQQLK